MTFSLVLPNLFLIFCLFCPSKAPTPTLPPQIRTFNSSLHPEFGNLRTLTIDGEPWFVGKDVAAALGYTNSRDAIATHVFADDKGGVESIDTLGGRQKMTIINESGLYALVFGSRLKIAKEFKHWVTSEVLPSIRKNGAYIRNQENMTPAEIVARGLIAAQKIIEERLDHSTQPLFILTYSH